MTHDLFEPTLEFDGWEYITKREFLRQHKHVFEARLRRFEVTPTGIPTVYQGCACGYEEVMATGLPVPPKDPTDAGAKSQMADLTALFSTPALSRGNFSEHGYANFRGRNNLVDQSPFLQWTSKAWRFGMAIKSRQNAVEVGDRVYFDTDKNDTGTVKAIRFGVPAEGGENYHPHWIALVEWDKSARTGEAPGELMEVIAAVTHPVKK